MGLIHQTKNKKTNYLKVFISCSRSDLICHALNLFNFILTGTIFTLPFLRLLWAIEKGLQSLYGSVHIEHEQSRTDNKSFLISASLMNCTNCYDCVYTETELRNFLLTLPDNDRVSHPMILRELSFFIEWVLVFVISGHSLCMYTNSFPICLNPYKLRPPTPP